MGEHTKATDIRSVAFSALEGFTSITFVYILVDNTQVEIQLKICRKEQFLSLCDMAVIKMNSVSL